MTLNLHVGDLFPDIELPDQRGVRMRISSLVQPSAMDEQLGFTDGYPLILIFGARLFLPTRPAPVPAVGHIPR